MLPGAFFVGAICGLLGGLFVLVNSRLGMLRKKYIKSNWAKCVEVAVFSLITSTCFYYAPIFFNDCRDDTAITSSYAELVVQYDCPPGQYSPLATMFMNAEGSVIRAIISGFSGPNGVIC